MSKSCTWRIMPWRRIVTRWDDRLGNRDREDSPALPHRAGTQSGELPLRPRGIQLLARRVSEVTRVAMYGALREHTIYLIVQADDLEALNRFLLPGMKVCTTKITPVGERPLPNWGS